MKKVLLRCRAVAVVPWTRSNLVALPCCRHWMRRTKLSCRATSSTLDATRRAIFCPREGMEKKDAEQSRDPRLRGDDVAARSPRQSPRPAGRAPTSRAVPTGEAACFSRAFESPLWAGRLLFQGLFKVPVGQATCFLGPFQSPNRAGRQLFQGRSKSLRGRPSAFPGPF